MAYPLRRVQSLSGAYFRLCTKLNMRISQHAIFHGVFRAPHLSGIPSMQDAEKEQRRRDVFY